MNDVDGKDIVTSNYVRYSDLYAKVDGDWLDGMDFFG